MSGGVDGVMGRQDARCRVRAMQLKLGYPADGYPTKSFVRKVR
jgi:hypothetical protein